MAILKSRRVTAIAILILAVSPFLSAQIKPEVFSGVKARSIGPANMSGRIGAIDVVAGDPNVIVVQTADLFQWRDRLSLDRFHPGTEGYVLIARRIADTF